MNQNDTLYSLFFILLAFIVYKINRKSVCDLPVRELHLQRTIFIAFTAHRMKLTFIVVDPSKLLVVLLRKLTQRTVCRHTHTHTQWSCSMDVVAILFHVRHETNRWILRCVNWMACKNIKMDWKSNERKIKSIYAYFPYSSLSTANRYSEQIKTWFSPVYSISMDYFVVNFLRALL